MKIREWIVDFGYHAAAWVALKMRIIVFWDGAYRYRRSHRKPGPRIGYYIEDIHRPKRLNFIEKLIVKHIRRKAISKRLSDPFGRR